MTADPIEPGDDPWAVVARLDSYAESGDRLSFGAELAELSVLVEAEPLWQWRLAMIRAAQAAFEGYYELARSLVAQAPDAARHDPTGAVDAIFRTFLARQTGSPPAEPLPAGPVTRLPAPAPLSRQGIVAAVGQAVVVCTRAEREAARALFDLLLPYAGRFASACAHAPSEGPVSLYLGMLAIVLEDWPTAEAQLITARTAARTAGSPPWEATAHFQLARLQQARDGQVGEEHLAAAIRLSEPLGMLPLAAAARALRPPVSVLTPREQEVVVLVAEGKSNDQIAWQLGMDEGTAESHVRHIQTKLRFDRRASIAAWHAQFAGGTQKGAPESGAPFF